MPLKLFFNVSTLFVQTIPQMAVRSQAFVPTKQNTTDLFICPISGLLIGQTVCVLDWMEQKAVATWPFVECFGHVIDCAEEVAKKPPKNLDFPLTVPPDMLLDRQDYRNKTQD